MVAGLSGATLSEVAALGRGETAVCGGGESEGGTWGGQVGVAVGGGQSNLF